MRQSGDKIISTHPPHMQGQKQNDEINNVQETMLCEEAAF